MSIKFTDNSDEVLDALDEAIERGLEAIGLAAEGHAKRKITSYPAIDTGRLRNSITYAISGNKSAISTYKDNNKKEFSYKGTAPADAKKAVYIGSNVEYAPNVELGTFEMPARPFLKPAATEHAEEYEALMRQSIKNA